MYNDERGVSIAVGYVLNLAIATILFSALLIGGSGLIESQTRIVTQDELSVTGQQLASELSSADRLVRAEVGVEGGPEELRLRTELPERTAAAGSYNRYYPRRYRGNDRTPEYEPRSGRRGRLPERNRRSGSARQRRFRRDRIRKRKR